MNRPLVPVALALAVGVCLTPLLAGTALAVAGFLALTGLCLLAAGGPLGRRTVGVLACCVAAGILLTTARARMLPESDALSRYVAGRCDPFDALCEGVVRSPEIYTPGEETLQFQLDVEHIEGPEGRVGVSGRALVRWYAPLYAVHAGDRVRVQGRVTDRLGPANFGGLDTLRERRRQEVFTLVRARADAVEQVAPAASWRPGGWISGLRQAHADRLSRAVPEGVRGFLLAVGLGERSGIGRDEQEAYLATGTAHILAVSGIHVSILFVSASFILGLLPLPERWRSMLVATLVIGFALLAGARAPALRAALMVCLYLAADAFGRERDAPTALAVAALVFLLWDPLLAFQPGFQLSFLSVASLLLYGDALRRAFPSMPSPFRDGLSASLAVLILPLPLACRYFHVLPLAGPLANLVVVPLLGAVLWLYLGVSVTVWLAPPLAPLIGYALMPVVGFIRGITTFLESARMFAPHVTTPSSTAVVVYSCAVVLLASGLYACRSRPGLLVAAGVLFIATMLFWQPLRHQSSITFLDVGHADAAVLRSPGGATTVVDTGRRWGPFDQGESAVAPYLWAHGIRRIDQLLVTHPDNDHAGGALALILRFPVGRVILSATESDHPLEQEIVAACEERAIPVVRVRQGDLLVDPDWHIEVLHPPLNQANTVSSNDRSVVLRITWDGVRFLLTGDIGGEAEAIMTRHDCHTDVLKASHHGSASSSTPALLDAARPRVVVVSTGDSSYGAPVPAATLGRFRERGLDPMRTDRLGAIRMTVRDGHLLMETARPVPVW